MALVYNASSESEAQKYERTAHMEPNPGVSALTVVNPGRAPGRNPFQWIEGRGQRHRHASPAYKGLRGALRWKGRAEHPRAKLYPVDELGTLVSRPVSKRLVTNRKKKRKNDMAYSVRSLRRSVRKNRHSTDTQSVLAAARAIDAGRSPSGVRRKKRKSKVTQRKSKSHATTKVAGHRKSRKRSLAAKRGWRKRKSAKVAHRKTSRKSARKSHKKAHRKSRRKSARKASRKSHKKAARRSKRRKTARKSSKRSAAAKKGWRSRKARRGAARRSRRRKGYGGHKFSSRGIRKRYHARGKIPAVRRVSRLFNRPDVMTIKKGVRGSSRMAANRRRRRRSTRRNPFYVMAPNRRRSRRRRTRRNPFYVTANRRSRRRRSRRMHSNRRMSKRRRSLAAKKGWRSRKARRGSRRRKTRRNPFYVTANRRRSRRRGSRRVRRNSRFRPFPRVNRRRSRRRSMRRNMLAQSVHGRGGRMMQVVELGPRSRSRKGRRMSGYPVYVPAHVSKHAYVRRFTFGGAAKDAHRRASSSTRERRKYPRRRVTQNRRRSMRRNPRYVFANRRHSRRHRRGHRMLRNMAADVMKDVLVPVAGGTAGFVAARVLSNAVAQVGAITNLLDKGQPAEMADNTKIVANLLAIGATLGVASKVEIVRKNQGAIITGMGLALVDRLLGKVGGAAGNYLSGMRGVGEYFEQPVAGLGAYVSDPTAGMGEYFEQPVAGLGAMYATAGTDGMIDAAEAAAGIDQAAAGLGMQYATAGLGQAHTPPVHDIGFQSIETPTDVAAAITTDLPYTRQVPTSLVGGEARGYAGGIFAGTVFSGDGN